MAQLSGCQTCPEEVLQVASDGLCRYLLFLYWHWPAIPLCHKCLMRCCRVARESFAALPTDPHICHVRIAPACMGKLDATKLKSLLQNYGCVNELLGSPWSILNEMSSWGPSARARTVLDGYLQHFLVLTRCLERHVNQLTITQKLCSLVCIPTTWTPKECKTMAQSRPKQLKRPLFYMLLGSKYGTLDSFSKDCNI